MPRLNRILTTVENVLAAGTLAAAVLIAFLAILLREVLGIFVFWSEEAIIYLIIFSTFFGAVVTLRHQEHVNVDIAAIFLGKRGKKILALVAATLTLVYLAVIGYFAWLLLFEPFSSDTVTPALKLPLWVVESAVPIGLTLMFLRAIELLVRVARGGVQEDPQEAALEAEAEAIGLDINDINRAVSGSPDTPDRDARNGTGADR